MDCKAKVSLQSHPAVKLEILYCLQIIDWLAYWTFYPSFCSTSWRSKFPRIIRYMKIWLDLGTVNPVQITVALLQLMKNICESIISFWFHKLKLSMGQIIHSQYGSRLLMLLYNLCPKKTAKIRVGGALPAPRLHTEPPLTKLLHGRS